MSEKKCMFCGETEERVLVENNDKKTKWVCWDCINHEILCEE